MAGRLYIDGLDADTTYGVMLTKSSGYLDFPKRKRSVSYTWEDEHGTEYDLSWNYYEERTIRLSLLIVGSSDVNLQDKLKAFNTIFRQTGLRQLRFGNVTKVYMVYSQDGAAVERISKWTAAKLIATIDIQLIEPFPISRQFTTTVTGATQVSITLTSAKTLTIFWGDGTSDTITGTSVTKTHSGYAAGTKYIVLAGDVDSISGFSKSANLTEI